MAAQGRGTEVCQEHVSRFDTSQLEMSVLKFLY